MSIEEVRRVRPDFVSNFWRFLNESAAHEVAIPEIVGWYMDNSSFERAREKMKLAGEDSHEKANEEWFWVSTQEGTDRSYTFFIDNSRPRSYWATFDAMLEIHFAETCRQGGGIKIPETRPMYM
jgi:hypothetical protein